MYICDNSGCFCDMRGTTNGTCNLMGGLICKMSGVYHYTEGKLFFFHLTNLIPYSMKNNTLYIERQYQIRYSKDLNCH